MKTTNFVAAAVAVAIVMILCGGLLLTAVPAPVAAAPVAQAAPPRTVTLYGPTAVTTGTTYSSAPLTVNSIDNAHITNYSQVDVFVSTDAGSTGSVVVTLQASPDETIWSDVTEIVHTFNTTGTLSSNTYTLNKTLSGASQTGMIRAPAVGEFVRVKVVATGAVTPTVKATYR